MPPSVNTDESNKSLSETSAKVLALDGLRGLAILLVLYHHSICWNNAYAWNIVEHPSILEKIIEFTAEWSDSGVDLFFVLSGFLITNILLRTKGSAHYYKNFYIRRALRIFPLYYLYLIFIFIILPHFCFDSTLANLLSKQGYYWAYAGNWDIISNATPSNMFLAHTWSLSIEEQFYLIWPFLVMQLSNKQIKPVLFSIFVGSTVLRFVLVALNTPLFFVQINTFCRLDTFAAGAFLAVHRVNKSLIPFPMALCTLFSCVFGCALVARFHLGKETFGLLLLCGLYVSLLADALRAHSNISRLFSNRILTFFGKYSYSIYLFHFPVVYWTQRWLIPILMQKSPSPIGIWLPEFCVVTLFSTLIGVATHFGYESYFLRLKDKYAAYK